MRMRMALYFILRSHAVDHKRSGGNFKVMAREKRVLLIPDIRKC